ncbi:MULTISPECIES: hypothetical protein [Enterobacterales]|nr:MULTISPECIES: hypothetical protein [Enterobacterales]ALV81832.1 hypothetical protein AOY08_100117 [Providencia rettgeri]ELR5224173.1 hypothetical protein [Providencia rettgeri]MCK9789603.1 hypothetical protein [Providencia rettgeri]MDX7324446.1 hypothetical protein [Providencia rettgeri]MDX7426038.1 hypothetical protein [Providencia sp. CIM-Carb-044]
MDIQERQIVEHRIVETAAQGLVDAGFGIAVYDGEELVTEVTHDVSSIMEAMFSTDEEFIYAYDSNGKHVGWVHLVYGNSGWDVISDNTNNLEDALIAATELAEEIADQS